MLTYEMHCALCRFVNINFAPSVSFEQIVSDKKRSPERVFMTLANYAFMSLSSLLPNSMYYVANNRQLYLKRLYNLHWVESKATHRGTESVIRSSGSINCRGRAGKREYYVRSHAVHVQRAKITKALTLSTLKHG